MATTPAVPHDLDQLRQECIRDLEARAKRTGWPVSEHDIDLEVQARLASTQAPQPRSSRSKRPLRSRLAAIVREIGKTVVLAGVLIWLVVGEPIDDVADFLADLLYSDRSAPWETVDAFYYPDKSDLAVDVRQYHLPTVDDCRKWARRQAAERGDFGMLAGDYECGVGFDRFLGDPAVGEGVAIYRLTLH